jgi:hypothetical protein
MVYKVLFGIITGVTAKPFVLDLQVRHRSGLIATSAASQDLVAQVFVCHWIDSQSGILRGIIFKKPPAVDSPGKPAAVRPAGTCNNARLN